MRLSLKLAVLFALAAFIPLFLVSLFIITDASSRTRNQAYEHLRSDVRAVASLCDKRLIELRAAAQVLADDVANRALVSADNLDKNNEALARLQDQLPRAQSDASLDFVIVADSLGRVIARHNDKPSAGETLLDQADKNALAEKVIAGGNIPVAACLVERGDRYTRLGLDRIAQVRLVNGTTLDQALMLEACAPIFSSGRFVGIVLIGQMLNTYYKARASSSPLQTPLVAEARQLLVHAGEDETGALISLEKAIVASSLPTNNAREPSGGPSLIGTIRDTSKTEETLQQDESRYAVAWQPLKSLDGATIGAIGVARAEREMGGVASTTAILIGGLASLLAAGIGFIFGRGMGARLEDLKDAAGRWSLGDLSTPARERDPFLAKWIPAEFLSDEINQLAEQLDQMRESFRQAIERLRKS
jgi:HAMP domain-containing protein